jgi:hypothetical protein
MSAGFFYSSDDFKEDKIMCADRATPLYGAFQKITLGATSKVLGAGKFSLSGNTRKTVDIGEFGVDFDIFGFGSIDGGTISISDATLDITDPMQTVLNDCVLNQTPLINSTTSGPRFWINSSSYYTIGTSGQIMMTSGGKVEADRNGVAKTSYEGKISGAAMYLV